MKKIVTAIIITLILSSLVLFAYWKASKKEEPKIEVPNGDVTHLYQDKLDNYAKRIAKFFDMYVQGEKITFTEEEIQWFLVQQFINQGKTATKQEIAGYAKSYFGMDNYELSPGKYESITAGEYTLNLMNDMYSSTLEQPDFYNPQLELIKINKADNKFVLEYKYINNIYLKRNITQERGIYRVYVTENEENYKVDKLEIIYHEDFLNPPVDNRSLWNGSVTDLTNFTGNELAKQITEISSIFTGKSFSDFVNETDLVHYFVARQLLNGVEKSKDEIAVFVKNAFGIENFEVVTGEYVGLHQIPLEITELNGKYTADTPGRGGSGFLNFYYKAEITPNSAILYYDYNEWVDLNPFTNENYEYLGETQIHLELINGNVVIKKIDYMEKN